MTDSSDAYWELFLRGKVYLKAIALEEAGKPWECFALYLERYWCHLPEAIFLGAMLYKVLTRLDIRIMDSKDSFEYEKTVSLCKTLYLRKYLKGDDFRALYTFLREMYSSGIAIEGCGKVTTTERGVTVYPALESITFRGRTLTAEQLADSISKIHFRCCADIEKRSEMRGTSLAYLLSCGMTSSPHSSEEHEKFCD